MTPYAFSLRRSRHLLLIVSLAALTVPGLAHAQDAAAEPAPTETAKPASTDEQIDFAAGRIDYDSNADVVTAADNVVLNRDGYSLRADTVIWNRKTGEVTANGNIKSIGPEGDVAYGDSIKLTDTLKDGLVENLLLVMADGGRLAAKRGIRTNGAIELEYAAYTGRSRPPKSGMIRLKNACIIPAPVLKCLVCRSFRCPACRIPPK
jgi:LPS-assembly protein